MAKDFITTKQAADILGVTDARVRQWLAGGLLEGDHFAGVWRIEKQSVLRLKRERAKGKKK